MMCKEAFLAFGSNIGNKKENILKAYNYIKENEKINIISKSSFYKTDPVGYVDQEDFINSVVKIETNFEPIELLEFCQFIEKKLKRKREIRWGPRIIDVDVLLYGDIYMDTERLKIPHPRMHERGFVLYPLKEISSEISINNYPIDYWIEKIGKKNIVVI